MKYCTCKEPIHDNLGWCWKCNLYSQTPKSKKLSQIAKRAWRGPDGRFRKVVQMVKNGKKTIEGLEMDIERVEQRIKTLEEKVEKLVEQQKIMNLYLNNNMSKIEVPKNCIKCPRCGHVGPMDEHYHQCISLY